MPQGNLSLKTKQDTKSYPVVEGGGSLTSLFYFCYLSLLKLTKEDGLFFQHIDKLRWYLGQYSRTSLHIKKSVSMKLNYLLHLTMEQKLNSKEQISQTHLEEYLQQW